MKTKKMMLAAGCTVLLSVVTACGTQTPDSAESLPGAVTTTQTENAPAEETVAEKKINPEKVIETLVAQYNELGDTTITDCEQMDIRGEDDRTEFRLAAFQNAVGMKGRVKNGTVEVVCYGSSGHRELRIYVETTDIETTLKVLHEMIKIMDNKLTDDSIESEYDALETTGSANLALGEGNYISGYINTVYREGKVDGYEAMIQCSDISHMAETYGCLE